MGAGLDFARAHGWSSIHDVLGSLPVGSFLDCGAASGAEREMYRELLGSGPDVGSLSFVDVGDNMGGAVADGERRIGWLVEAPEDGAAYRCLTYLLPGIYSYPNLILCLAIVWVACSSLLGLVLV